MALFSRGVFALLVGFAMAGTHAQTAIQTSGAVVTIPAFGEVRRANDEAHATLMIEEQDRDKAAAASRVNKKMRQGMDIIKREDPQAILQTRGYYTYPVYADDQLPRSSTNASRQPVRWRVGQYLELTTTNLDGLPKMIASAQSVLALTGLSFGLTEATARRFEEQRIAAAYRNLIERITAIAKAMGRNPADAAVDTLDFDAPGVFPQQEMRVKTMQAAAPQAAIVEEPSFEPGETVLGTRLIAKVRFK